MMKTKNRNIPLLLLRAREAMMGYYRPVLNKNQLTEQQWRVLNALHEYKQLEPHELCNHCCILSPSMAGILKRMEELKLINKIASNTDKRRVFVMLAQGIEEKIQTILAESNHAYDELLNKIGESELSGLVERLENVLAKLN